MRYQCHNPLLMLAVALCVVTLALPVLADGNLEVKCVDQSGAALSGVKVNVQDIDTNKTKDKKSDNKGIAAFTKLDDGVYRVIGRKDGFAPGLYEFVLIKPSSQQSVTVRLEPGSAESKLYFEDPAIDGKAYEALGNGIQALQAGKFADAEKILQVALQLNPTNQDILFNLAIACIQQRKWEPTEEALKKTVAVTSVLKELPRARQAGEKNPYAEIQQRAELLMSKIPVFRLRSEAEKALSERRFDEAIAKYQEALKSEPGDPDLHHNLGLALANAKRFEEADQAIDKAIQLKPGEAAYLDMKKRITAVRENEILTKARTILEEGDKLYQDGDYAGALKKYEEGRAVLPEKNQAGVWVQMGRTYAHLKQPDPAIQAFKRAIELSPEETQYRKAMAQFYIDEKRYEEALNLYTDPKAKGPADGALFELGQSLSQQGSAEVAELAFEKALAINPNHADACYELGMLLYYSKKNDKRAKELLTKYLEIGKAKDRLDNTNAVLVVIKRRSP